MAGKKGYCSGWGLSLAGATKEGWTVPLELGAAQDFSMICGPTLLLCCYANAKELCVFATHWLNSDSTKCPGTWRLRTVSFWVAGVVVSQKFHFDPMWLKKLSIFHLVCWSFFFSKWKFPAFTGDKKSHRAHIYVFESDFYFFKFQRPERLSDGFYVLTSKFFFQKTWDYFHFLKFKPCDKTRDDFTFVFILVQVHLI